MKKIFLLVFLLFPLHSQAAIKTGTLSYTHNNVPLEGYYAYDDSIKTPTAAILVAHAWNGITNYEKSRIEQLATLGYVVMGLDMYGKNKQPTSMSEAAALSRTYKSNLTLLRERATHGLQALLSLPNVNSQNITVVGYCFGGTVALEMARDSAPVKRVVSFHGGLKTTLPAKSITARILALHGGDDPFVPPFEVDAFEKEMRASKADWQLITYGQAVHAFSDPGSGNDPSTGAAYNPLADKRSWQAFITFLQEP